MSRPHFWMVWRCHGIPCVHFYFLFWTIIRKRYFDESDFHHCYGNFFESAVLNVVWSQLYSKFFLNSCEVHWPQHFERHPAVEDLRKWTKIRADCFIKIWVNIIERKSTKVPWRLPLAKKYDPALQRKLHHLLLHASFSLKQT